MTEKEEKRLRRKEDSLLRELRIFLRETWNKINREQKFFMFRTEIDTEEVSGIFFSILFFKKAELMLFFDCYFFPDR